MRNIIVLSLITSTLLYSETTEEKNKILKEKLFEKAFKKKSQTKEFYLPLRVNNILHDEFLVKIDNQEHISVTKITMNYIASLLKESYKKTFNYEQLNPDGFAPLSALEQFGIKATYNNKNITLDLSLPLNIKKASLIRFSRRGYARDLNGSILPQNYSGGVNFYLNKQYAKDSSSKNFNGNPLNVASDITLNADGYVLEGRVQYIEKAKKELSRGRFRVVKDDPENHLRYTMGDIILPHHDRMSYQTTLGVGVEKIFNIGSTYHQNISRINSYEFFLQNKSRVEIYVNERYKNSITLIGGTHNLYDLNLPSGINRVKLKIIEDGGKIEYLKFNDFSYSEVLQKGLIKYGVGAGVESELQEHQWGYKKDKKIASAYVEYGLLDSITVESGIQSAEEYLSGDLELLIGTNFGLFNPYIIATQMESEEGYKKGLDYRTNIYQTSLNLGYQETDDAYRVLNSSSSSKSRLYRGNIYSQLGYGVSMGLNASHYTKESIEEKKYGLTLTKNIGQWLTQLDFDQTEKEGEEREKQLYLSVEYRFGQNRARVVSYLEDEQREQFSLSHNSEGRYGLSNEFQYEHSSNTNRYNLRANFDDEKFRVNSTYNLLENRERDGTSQSFSVQLATGMVFAGDRATITTPLNSSFVIVENDKRLEKPLGLLGYQESDAVIYNEFAVNLSDYSERELSIDESELDFGIDLKESQQKFVSSYKSGSVMKIAVQNLYSIRGVFYDNATKKPLKFKAFKLFNTLTGEQSRSFCNENGEFSIPQAEVGSYNITFMKERGYEGVARYSFNIKEDKNQQRVIDLGAIYIDMPKKKEAKKYLIYNKKDKNINKNFKNILQNISFETNSYALTPQAKERLDIIGKELKRDERVKLDIIGHSDMRDNVEYNMELSHRRAITVKEYLQEKGLKNSQLNALGVGKEQKGEIELKGKVVFQLREPKGDN